LESKPLVTFVILNWNQPEMTAECLESIRQQDYDNYHVLVVDNGSRDNSVEVLNERFPWVELLALEENIGYGMGNNAGIEHVLRSPTDYIPTMYYFEPSDVIWSGENYVTWRTGKVTRKNMGEHVSQDLLRQMENRKIDHVDTCASLVKREVFESIGMLDPRYFINYEDLDFDLRAKQAGFDLVYVPHAFMWHKVSLAMGFASPATTYHMTRNALLLFWTRAPIQWKPIALASIIARTVRTMLAWSLKSEYKTEEYQRKLRANAFALRDFFLRRFGRMGEDVARVCYPS